MSSLPLTSSNDAAQDLAAFTGRTVAQLVVERPGRTRIFERLGLDYCCGGRKRLDEACQAKGLDPASVVSAIQEYDRTADATDERDWSAASMTELADDIERTHHAMLRMELPRLAAIIAKVQRAHGARHPELASVAAVFEGLAREMFSHMQKEEQVLFPRLRAMERGESGPGPASVAAPIGVMVQEHDDAGGALAQLRELTGGYLAPPDACGTFRAMMDGLAWLESDMHRHVHKENNILFPAALAAEKRMQGGSDGCCCRCG